MRSTDNSMKRILFFILVFIALGSLKGQSILGVWKTVDDQTGDTESLVEIYEDGNVVYGKFVKLLKQPKKEPICERCPGEDKNAPLVGLVFIKDLVKKGTQFKGSILNPKDGRVYNCLVSLKDDKTLKVRGYLGVPLLGRTQYWHRVN